MKDQQFINALKLAFEKSANPYEAQRMSAYMKEQCPFYGIKAGPRRVLFREVLNTYGKLNDPIGTARALFLEEKRELHMCGQEILYKAKKQWTADTIRDIEWFICTKSWWDSVDFLASRCAGEFFLRFPEQRDEITWRWNQSGHLWLIRSSILFQLFYKEKTDTHLLSKYIENQTDHTDFFIRKAIGWALRAYSQVDPEWVKAFVSNHRLSKLSEKEALRLIQ